MSEELRIMQHTIGVDQYGQGEQYRNHFATGEGGTDWPICNSLVERGLMDVRRSHPLNKRLDCFWLTDTGKKFVAENSPKPPKLSRSKERYRRYLEYGDSFESFRDFLKWDCSPGRSSSRRAETGSSK